MFIRVFFTAGAINLHATTRMYPLTLEDALIWFTLLKCHITVAFENIFPQNKGCGFCLLCWSHVTKGSLHGEK